MGSMFNMLIQVRGAAIYDLPRSIFSIIDYVIYWAVAEVYGLIEDLAHVSVFGVDTLNAFYSKVYALLSIFMLFKLSFSIVSYILDPAKVTDKTAGFGKTITNVVIMFVMMLSAPVAFKYLTKLQNAILDDDVIENFIFSVSDSNTDFNSFQVATDESCSAWHDKFPSDFNETAGIWTAKSKGDAISLKIYRVFLNLSEDAGGTRASKVDNVSILCERNDYGATVKDITDAVNDYVEKSGKGKYYVLEYRMFLSTVVGGFVLFMFVSMVFDIAVRTVKLGFLQLIAPIPIMSYIDPKSSQNGMFIKWLKEVGKTWASLFIKLFSVYFAVFVISKLEIIIPSDYETNSSTIFIELFIIIGALMFAKQLPGLLEQLFPGMKMGKMELNPLKKIANEAIGGKYIAGAAVGAAAMAPRALSQAGSNLYAFGRNRSNLKKGIEEAHSKGDFEKEAKLRAQLKRNNFGRAIGTGFGGLAGGATRGLKSGYKTGTSGSFNVFKGTKDDLKNANTKRNNRAAINDYNAELKRELDAGKISEEEYENARYGFFERNIVEKMDEKSGVKNSYGGYGYYNNKISELQRKIENNNASEQSARTAVSNYSSNHGVAAEALYKFHEANANKSHAQLEQELLDKYTKDANGAIKREINQDGKIMFKDTSAEIAARESYEKEKRILDAYKEQKAQIESIYKIDEDTKELKKQQKQYKEMLDSRPDAGASGKK